METPIDSLPEILLNLVKNLEESTLLQTSLETSLNKAKESAVDQLNDDLYQALDQLYKGHGWPVTWEGYIDFLAMFWVAIPSENQVPGYTAWNNNDQQNGYSQEIYDRLCQFYWLIDQPIQVEGQDTTMQEYVDPQTGFSFPDFLVSYNDSWGEYLNTPESLTPDTLESFALQPMYNLEDSSNYIPTWNCFNDFFYRKLNPYQTDGTPMRPIAFPGSNQTVVSPADCTFKQIYPIDGQGNVEAITLKHTHTIGTVSELLNGSKYADAFNGGTFVHYFLSPFDYHRFHVPVNGTVLSSEAVTGQTYLAVNITDGTTGEPSGQFDAPDSGDDGYEFRQARGVLILETEDIGKVAVIPVGMCQVSSVHMELKAGDAVKKGDEFGYFAFGGSDIIVVLENAVSSLDIVKYDAEGNPLHFMYGEPSITIAAQPE